MKRISKSLAVFLTAVLALGMLSLPTLAASVAQTSYDMEVWDVDGEGNAVNPKGFTITSENPENVIISCDESDVGGNTSKKLKIEHTEDTTTRVTVHVMDKDVAYTPLSVYWSFFLGDDFEGTGLKLYSMRGEARTTNYFKDNKNYTWWRKMMVFHASYAYHGDFVAEFTGTGTVYLDDVTWELSKIINGGFEGVCGDGHLAGEKRVVNGQELETGGNGKNWPWRFYAYSTLTELVPIIRRTSEENPPESLAAGKGYFVETPNGNYIETNSCTRSYPLQYGGTTPSDGSTFLSTGKTYVFRAYHMSSNKVNGLGFLSDTTDSGFKMPAYTYPYWTKASTTMSEKRFYNLYESFGNKDRLVFSLHTHANKKASTSTEIPYSRIDDVSVEEVQESCTLTDADGNPVAFENGKTVKVSYQKPLFDDAKDIYAAYTQAEVNGKKSTEKVTVFSALYDVTEATPKLIELDVCGSLAAEALFPTGVPTTAYDTLGFLPATYTMEEGFEIPETGKYMLKVFTMDSVSGLSPKGENVYTFTTEAE